MATKLTVYVATDTLKIQDFQKALISICPFFTWNDSTGCWSDDTGKVYHEKSCSITFLLKETDPHWEVILDMIRQWVKWNSQEQAIAWDLVECQGGCINTTKPGETKAPAWYGK